MFQFSLLTNKDSYNTQIIQCINDTIFRKRFRIPGFGTGSGTLEPVPWNQFLCQIIITSLQQLWWICHIISKLRSWSTVYTGIYIGANDHPASRMYLQMSVHVNPAGRLVSSTKMAGRVYSIVNIYYTRTGCCT